jgi:hypothetical protein
MFVVLITDFANANEIVGPFDTKPDAYRWAEVNVKDIYRIVELKAPDTEAVVVAAE